MKSNKTNNDCDCTLGVMEDEPVTKSTIEWTVNSMSNSQHEIYKQNPKFLTGKPHTPRQIVDARKGYLHRFTYCPYCGEKINWVEILKIFKK